MPPTGPVTLTTEQGPAAFLDAVSTVAAFRALDAAGLLGRLDGDVPIDELLAASDLDPRRVRLGLEVLEHAGVVRRTAPDRWQSTVPPQALRDLVRNLEEADLLAAGGPRFDVSVPTVAEATYPAIVEALDAFARPLTPRVVPVLLAAGPVEVIELAAGSSPWGRAMCAVDPRVRVTAVDLPAVLERTRSAVRRHGLLDRYRFVAGDVFAIDDLPPADLVVVSGFCRLLDADANRRLFARVGRWCRPGGRIAVVDAVDTVAARAAGLARYELGLLSRSSGGRCWDLDRYARWLTDAGFGSIDVAPTDRPEITVLTATREEAP